MWASFRAFACNRCHIAVHKLWRFIIDDDMDSGWNHYAFYSQQENQVDKGGAKMDKVIDIEERIPSMREKRRRKTNKKFLFMLTVFVVALLAILYFQSPLSKVEDDYR